MYSRWIRLFVVLVCTLANAPLSWAADRPAAQLAARHAALKAQLADNPFGVPLHLESRRDGNLMRGNIYAVLDHPFGRVSNALRGARNWCDIVPLHLNVKACTYRASGDNALLTFYSGRKFYQPPERAQAFEYEYRVGVAARDYVAVTLKGQPGGDTRDQAFTLEVIPLDRTHSFVRVAYSFQNNRFTRLMMDGYFATVGSRKVGFSVAGTDAQGQPAYVGGVDGAIERNAMRYFLAVQAYLDTLIGPAPKQFESRLSRWFDLTDRYHAQLYELDKGDYLKYKREERTQQLRLQQGLEPAAAQAG